jgi:hypothetical protein
VSDGSPVPPDFVGNMDVFRDDDGGTPEDVIDVLTEVPAEPARRAITSVLTGTPDG